MRVHFTTLMLLGTLACAAGVSAVHAVDADFRYLAADPSLRGTLTNADAQMHQATHVGKVLEADQLWLAGTVSVDTGEPIGIGIYVLKGICTEIEKDQYGGDQKYCSQSEQDIFETGSVCILEETKLKQDYKKWQGSHCFFGA